MTSLLIAFLLILSPLIISTIRISKLENNFNDISMDVNKRSYLKRDLSIRAISGSDLSIGGTNDTFIRQSIENILLFDDNNSESKVSDNKKETNSNSESRYQSLAIVCSVCAVIVLSIGLTVLYIHFKRGNNLSQESLNTTNVIQFNSISETVDLDLDIMSGTHYLNTGVMAFSDITSQILTTHQNNNLKKTENKTF